MRFLLDTNTCIELMRSNPKVISKMASVVPGDCAISSITSYELYTGVEKCADPIKERSKVELLLNTVHLVPFDDSAAQNAARIRAALEAVGTPIGPYDVLLAGHALALSVSLVTANTKEFGRVTRLPMENWQI